MSAPRPDVAGRSAEIRAYLEGLDLFGMRLGLARMRLLVAELGHPERGRPGLHVVGTNGKSSTARLAAAALSGEGLLTGTYLSPHLSDWTERIQIDGRPVDEEVFASALMRVREASERLALPPGEEVTQFEALTAAAFLVFTDARAGAMVVEAGLGGRHDATNVMDPATTTVALTNVALEHTDVLGDTEEAIAAEKLAVAPAGHPRVVVGALAGPAAEAAVAAEIARRRLSGPRYGHTLGAREGAGGVTVTTPRARYADLPLPVHGWFQRENLAVALAGAELLLGRPLDPGRLRAALAGVAIPGRLERLPGAPTVVLDGAHNPAGMEAMARALPAVVGDRPVVAVCSVLGDKDASAMVDALLAAPGVHRLVATRSSHPRAASTATLAGLVAARGVAAEEVEEPWEALAVARARAGRGGAVVVCGSLYLLADFLRRRERLLAAVGARDETSLAGVVEDEGAAVTLARCPVPPGTT